VYTKSASYYKHVIEAPIYKSAINTNLKNPCYWHKFGVHVIQTRN